MPTLLDLAGIDIPDTVDGISMVRDQQRPILYGEVGENHSATRMVHDGRFKLIYYPVGNCTQLFDLQEDPTELHNLSDSAEYIDVRQRLTVQLIDEMYGVDEAWIEDGTLVGLPAENHVALPNRGLSGQRGLHWPPPPLDQSGRVVGFP